MASYTKAYCLSQHCYGQALVMVSDVAARRRSVPICFAPRPLGFAIVPPNRSAPSFLFFNGHHLRVCTVQETPRVYSISLRFWAEPADATQNLRVCILQETPRVYSISLRFWAEPADATQREQGHDG